MYLATPPERSSILPAFYRHSYLDADRPNGASTTYRYMTTYGMGAPDSVCSQSILPSEFIPFVITRRIHNLTHSHYRGSTPSPNCPSSARNNPSYALPLVASSVHLVLHRSLALGNNSFRLSLSSSIPRQIHHDPWHI
jgi:hypothetical protein